MKVLLLHKQDNGLILSHHPETLPIAPCIGPPFMSKGIKPSSSWSET